MAQRRMFSKTITGSSQFLMMPQSSQNLYFHLGMNADDDGFCEHFAIMRMTDSKPDDLKVLQAKSFVQVFDDRVLVIRDWKENNYLRSDRYTPSKYLEIYKKELKRLSSGIPKVDEMATQVRLGKDRIGEVSIGNNTEHSSGDRINPIILLFKEVNPSYKLFYSRIPQRLAIERLLDTHGEALVVKVITLLPKTNAMEFLPTITTPIKLEERWADLEAGLKKMKNKGQDKGRGLEI